MRHFAIIALCAFAFAAPHAAAQNGSNSGQAETLSHFLARCDAGDPDCQTGLMSGFDAAIDLGYICPPGNLTDEQAAATELTWLRNAAGANQTMANGEEEEAEFTALSTLWPCNN